jgi:methionine-gamma-lyase
MDKFRPIFRTNSLIVHSGNPEVAPDYFPTVMPVYASVTFRYQDIDHLRKIAKVDEFGFDYSRAANPTRQALEKVITELEGGYSAWACNTGMSAVFLSLLAAGFESGDHILVARETYSGNHRLFLTLVEQFHVNLQLFNIARLDELEEILNNRKISYRLLFCESISNPTNIIADLERIADLCKKKNITFIVDNTLATPILCKPLDWGADIVVHSLSKTICGHGDVMGGIVVCQKAFSTQLREYGVQMGFALGPHDAWLIHRGLRTLHLRVKRQCKNALKIAHFLQKCPHVNNVKYVGLVSDPQRSLAKKLFKQELFGSVITFDLTINNFSRISYFLQSFNLILAAGSVGDIYSQVFDQFSLSLSELSKRDLYQLGITERTIRLSVGIEDYRDLIADIEHALYKLEE